MFRLMASQNYGHLLRVIYVGGFHILPGPLGGSAGKGKRDFEFTAPCLLLLPLVYRSSNST